MKIDDRSGGRQVLRAAAVCYTDRGEENAWRVSGLDIYRHGKDFDRTGDLLKELIRGKRRAAAIVFFSAAGIAVRTMAPYIVSKTTDPAVIVVNDAADYVIPVLSGHIGRANDIARELADWLDAEPVITTATDHMAGTEAVDVRAQREGYEILSMRDAKAVTAAMAGGMDVQCSRNGDGTVTCAAVDRSGCRKAEAVLYPEKYVVGVGCRKNTDAAAVLNAVDRAIGSLGLRGRDVFKICSVDLKASEDGIIDTAMKLKKPFVVFTAGHLNRMEGDFTPSDFVKKVTGTDSVCERSAIAGCGAAGGKLIMRKTAMDGVTVAVAERNMKWNCI